MCFSAPVSFVTGGALGGIGLAAKKHLRKKNDIPLLAIPFVFSFQQIVEGFVWLGDKQPWQIYFAYLYVLIAFIFWPAFVPIAFYLQEPSSKVKKLLKYFIPVGLALSVYLLIFLFINPLLFQIQNNHIIYSYNVPGNWILMILYLVVTVFPPLLSSGKYLKLFGALIAVSYLVSLIFFYEALFSVWCFFAAALSVIVYLHFRAKRIH